ncbi:sirohydrochlorin chelatase [uncultured Jatrophihabitans sp.]|uniref:sirohydrochlorin chelatase n=1 Tax=uncultured Jatrophihabitans sp. TaxID=1610747 RepID=UPI0035C9C6AD
MRERLIAVAHGTASAAGRATVEHLIAAVRAARPDVAVELCFLDVLAPRLPQTLADLDGAPAVVVPVLLSTGYHVRSDIPSAVAAHPEMRVARHLGPHPLLTDVLVDRLAPLRGDPASVVLVGAGSSRAEAAGELDGAAQLLAQRVGLSVTTATMADPLREVLAKAPQPLHVATYLLAPGTFTDTLQAAATGVDGVQVAAPLGAHPAVVELVWRRYDECVGAPRVV